jgi:hypothetical protein
MTRNATPTAPTRTHTIGSCSSSGDHAACALNVRASRPVMMHAYLTATPNQAMEGQYTLVCAHGDRGAGGTFDSRARSDSSCAPESPTRLPAHSASKDICPPAGNSRSP